VALLLSPQEESLYIGSAATIEVCGRYFLATVAHNLDSIFTRDQLRALPAGRPLERPLYIREWNSAHHASSGDLDVAWLEVETVSAAASTASFIPVTSVLCGEAHQEQIVFLVQGYPEASITREDVFEGVPLLCGTCVYSFSVPPSASAFAPSGVSGGGVWIMPRFVEIPEWTSQIFAWRRLRELGAEPRHLVTTRMEHWLRLLAEDKPYPRKEINSLLEAIEA
jgi:hypothetical protein